MKEIKLFTQADIDRFVEMEPDEMAHAIAGAVIRYMPLHGRERHMRIDRVRKADELGAWGPAKCGGPDKPAIYTSKKGILCLSCETVDIHGIKRPRKVKDSENDHRTLYVEEISPA